MKKVAILFMTVAVTLSCFGTAMAVTSFAGGYLHSVVLQNDGTILAWGDNRYGMLGDITSEYCGPYICSTTPIQVSGGEAGTEFLTGVTAINAGRWHTIALRNDGTVWTWGSNTSGQLGIGIATNGAWAPVQVPRLTDVIDIASGGLHGEHTIILKSNGTVWAWGKNDKGQLGVTSSETCWGHPCSTMPIQVSGGEAGTEFLTDIIAIAGGSGHTIALRNDGTVWAWGDNGVGQLGRPTTAEICGNYSCSSTPVKVHGLTDVVAIASGGHHNTALKSDGTLWSWGYNNLGQLGVGPTSCCLATPVQVKGGETGTEFLTGVVSMANGFYHTIALRNDGTVWAWGGGSLGRLGRLTTEYCGPVECSTTPLQVSGGDTGTAFLTDVIAIANGSHHNIAQKSDGTLWSWGYNASSQLGDGTFTDRYAPIQVPVQLNGPPVAHAGPDQSVHPGNLVTLDGSNSADPDGHYPLSYTWHMLSTPPGSTAVLADPSALNPTFTADVTGDYTIQLTVTDSLGLSSPPDEVLVSTSNTPPVADAGSDQAMIQIGTTVQLDGTQSYDEDGDPLTYAWTLSTKPVGSSAVLSHPAAVNPTFVADVQGDYVIALLVSDPWAASDPTQVTVSFTNVTPVAHAGVNQSVVQGETVSLNGSQSTDANLDPLTYIWRIVSKPLNSLAALSDATVRQPSFVADMGGKYVVSLVVNDGLVNSEPSNVTMMAIAWPDAVTQQVQDLMTTMNGLDPAVFKNTKMRNTLTNKVNTTLEKVDQGFYQDALDKLEHDIIQKTNGCADAGSPDHNDWIQDCSAQHLVYPLITDAIDLLRNLI
jgi:alpha-tubulin suppressor-like RCC1 family protein